MNTKLIAELDSVVSTDFKLEEPMAPYSHYKIGGPAKYFAVAETTDEIVKLVRIAIAHEVDWVVIGAGTNILVNDNGYNGLVIKMANRSIQIDSESGEVVVEAGALSSMLARQTATAGLTGFEWAIGLPGTIGGAVRGNSGCFGGETKDSLVSVDIVDGESGEIERVSVKDLKMGYRDSIIKHKPWIVLRAQFKLEKRDVESNLEKVDDVLQCRANTQPKNLKCAGCTFKNFEYKEENDISKLVRVIGRSNIPPSFLERKRIPAGWIIDQADLKGFAIDGVSVSKVHGNFLVNDGRATADHIVQLIAALKSKVRNKFGVQLQEEIQYIGF